MQGVLEAETSFCYGRQSLAGRRRGPHFTERMIGDLHGGSNRND